jgi:hypothetical protein
MLSAGLVDLHLGCVLSAVAELEAGVLRADRDERAPCSA